MAALQDALPAGAIHSPCHALRFISRSHLNLAFQLRIVANWLRLLQLDSSLSLASGDWKGMWQELDTSGNGQVNLRDFSNVFKQSKYRYGTLLNQILSCTTADEFFRAALLLAADSKTIGAQSIRSQPACCIRCAA